jgi:uncharacterized protein YhaN
MRLTSFALENYGNFASARLALDSRAGRINLVPAPNGGGKTVLRQAFRDLLFGIPSQTEMAFLYGYHGMRLFAEGIDTRGAPFAFGRRKGNGNTLIDCAGNVVGPEVLARLIGDIDEGVFKRLFALDSQLLRAGAEAMLDSGGDLAETLFAAGSGIANVRRLRAEFEERRDRLAPVNRVRTRPFYQAHDNYVAAQRQLRTATLRPRNWEALKEQLDFIRGRWAALARDQGELGRAIETLQRVKRVRPWLDQWREARQRCDALATVTRLAADIEERWRGARQGVELAERELKAGRDALDANAVALFSEQPDEKLLAEAAQIEALDRAQAQIGADQRDLPRREAERREAVLRAETALTALGAGFDDIAGILPNGPQIAAARQLVKRHAVCAERLDKAEREVGKHQVAMRASERAIAEIGAPPDHRDLAALLGEARVAGEPRRRLAELEERQRQDEAWLTAALAKVPLWDRGADALVALVPPTRETIDRAAAALAAATTALAETEREHVRMGREETEAQQHLQAARQGKPVPDAATVAAARRHRDRGWSLIRRCKFEREPLDAEIEAYASGVGIAAAFERAVSEADDLADRRDEESVRLATIAGLEQTVARHRNGIERSGQQLAEARRTHREALAAWTFLTAGFGFAIPPEPADLQSFLAARDVVLDRRAARDAAQQALAAEAARQEAMRLRFARLMPQPECASLAEAIASAQQAIDRVNALRKERDRLEHEFRIERGLHAQFVEERNAAQAALNSWREEWQLCLAALKRPDGETPAGVERAIELIEEAHRERQRVLDLDHRINGMRANIGGFAAQVAGVVAVAASDLAGRPPEAAAQEMRRRLDAQRQVLARRDQLLRQQQTLRAKLADAEAGQRQVGAARESIRTEVGDDSDEEIVAHIAASAERVRAEASLRDCERKLADVGDGRTIAELDAEVAGISADLLDTELGRLRLESERLTQDREHAASEEQRVADELRRIETGENALVAEEARQAAIASMTRVRDEAVLYHAAACLLQAGLDRLRAGEDSGLLRRIGLAFSRITRGAYCGVDADEDEKGAPFLVALEAGAPRTKRVMQLSEGTRDQLFLALRLVMLEDYAVRAPAPPFVADDLLQTFDDYGRTASALAALADLSEHVQVIVLSHHRRLADVARRLPEGIISVCDLAA